MHATGRCGSGNSAGTFAGYGANLCLLKATKAVVAFLNYDSFFFLNNGLTCALCLLRSPLFFCWFLQRPERWPMTRTYARTEPVMKKYQPAPVQSAQDAGPALDLLG